MQSSSGDECCLPAIKSRKVEKVEGSTSERKNETKTKTSLLLFLKLAN